MLTENSSAMKGFHKKHLFVLSKVSSKPKTHSVSVHTASGVH